MKYYISCTNVRKNTIQIIQRNAHKRAYLGASALVFRREKPTVLRSMLSFYAIAAACREKAKALCRCIVRRLIVEHVLNIFAHNACKKMLCLSKIPMDFV